MPPRIIEKAKERAREKNVTLSLYVEEAVRSALSKDESTPSESVVKLPTFNCGGPALIDLEDKDALWEALDDRS